MIVDRRALLTCASAALSIGHAARSQPGAAASELAYRTSGELRAMLDARRISSLELTDAAIARIEAHDGRLNAVCVRDFERARVAAAAADAALARGERRPLLGIPMTVKESFNVAGLPTTWGLPIGRDWRPEEDAVTVARLKAAGAVILGKTNVATALADWQSDNPVYGRTNNPYDVARSAGGSSGGAAAALAAGFTPLELGSDIGGSIRVPAHLVGVYGHKPSAGIVPLRGHTPPRAAALRYDVTNGLSVCGPMARPAADLALALDLLAGPDDDSAVAYRLALPPPRRAGLRDHRVLVLDTHPGLPTASEVRGALDTLATRLAGAGAAVARTSPLVPELLESSRLHVRLARNVTSFGQPPAFFAEVREQAAQFAPDDNSPAARFARAPLMSHHEWIIAEAQRVRLRDQWRALFREFDVVLCPPFSVAAFPHDSTPLDERRITIDGAEHRYRALIVWSSPATAPGLPATVAPIGRTAGGLPVGVQIIGPYLEDRTPIAFAGLIEREFGGFEAPPGYPG